ncbi:MAG TPA: hypothetical protein VFG76_01035 [Candidatus Polarisedimenticolia bacterium]|nr:hypothetical protein [Candidatus Polarisedimenticolia bacterium]
MKKSLVFGSMALLLLTTAARADAPRNILSWSTMYGVDGAFVGQNPIRGVLGDELPWRLESARGSLGVDGHLKIAVRGLVFTDDPEVPPDKRGINDEPEFRALVSCLSENQSGGIDTVNLTTEGFPASRSGDSRIDTFVELPEDCIAPTVFILAGSESFWFAVNGAETE